MNPESASCASPLDSFELTPMQQRLLAIGEQIRISEDKLSQLFDLYVEPYGLTTGAMKSLTEIRVLGDRATLSAIGERIRASASTMTGIANQLEREDLVVRQPSPTDRRASILVLTDKGERVAQSALQDMLNNLGAEAEYVGVDQIDYISKAFDLISDMCDRMIDRKKRLP